jgi:hypothetical protein
MEVPLNGITSTKFHENLPSGSEVISVGHTDRQTGDLTSQLSFLGSRLKKGSGMYSYPQFG